MSSMICAYHRPRIFKHLRPFVLICSMSVLSLTPVPSHADWRDAIGAAAGSLSEGFSRQAEADRQLEEQKKLLEYQYKLEREKREREYQLENERREQARVEQESRRIAAEEKKKRDEEDAKRRALNTGTGFVIAPGGYLVTNNHVIEDKTDYAVRDYKGRFYKATVIARDSDRDLVLLKVGGAFPSLRVASSESVSKGQHVLAVGYPQIAIQGNESKVTDGIISSFSGIKNDDNWFQISVPIQGGNSGGPLVTESGVVIGVVAATANVARYYKMTGNLPQNVNYAIKSKVLLDFLKFNNVQNVATSKGKTSIDAVDASTMLVIAKNGPIDVSYTVSPEQLARDERERARLSAEEAKRQKEEKLAELKSLSEQRRTENERKEVSKLIERRDQAVMKSFPDWPEIKSSDIFAAWLTEQSKGTAEKLNSPKSADVLALIRQYQSELPRFVVGYLASRQQQNTKNSKETTPSVSEIGKVFQDCADCPELVVIPAGNFEMGANSSDSKVNTAPPAKKGYHSVSIGSSEKPVHTVRISKAFALGKTEVTQRQWRAIMGPDRSSFKDCDECPVENVSWDDAREYVRKLGQNTGKSYRLPSEAEWEYACRAEGRHEYCGSESIDRTAWYANNSGGRTHPVAGKQANAWGLFDMSGNVWEWTEDCWNENYNKAPDDGSAWTTEECTVGHVLRGGSWDSSLIYARSAIRIRSDASFRNNNYGIRVARTLP